MKKSCIILLIGICLSAAVIFTACTSVSLHPSAYVEGTENFVPSDIVQKTFSRTLNWQNYEMKFENVKNTLHQKTHFGKGNIKGSLSQKGTFYKDGQKCFDIEIINDIDGSVREDKSSTTKLLDESYRVEIDSGKTVIKLEKKGEEVLLNDSQYIPLVFKEVTSSINEHGKIYKMWFNTSMGVSVEVDGELYAVVDYYFNPARVRENPAYSKNLTDEQRDYVSALILMIFHYDSYFSHVETEPAVKIEF